ncbi:MAG: hypothetical protein E7491_01560 [Ruminococcaceae bacterium]|nr:hypothetical protein [Oscillospiraceae bacterium]
MISTLSTAFMLISGVVSLILPIAGMVWILYKGRGSAYVSLGGAATHFLVQNMLVSVAITLFLYWLPHVFKGSPKLGENEMMPSVFGENMLMHEVTATAMLVVLEVLFIFLAMKVGFQGKRTGVSAIAYGFGYAISATFFNCAIKSIQYFAVCHNINTIGADAYVELSGQTAAQAAGATEQSIAAARENAKAIIDAFSSAEPVQFLYPLLNAVLLTVGAVSMAIIIFVAVFNKKIYFAAVALVLEAACKIPLVFKSTTTTQMFNWWIDIAVTVATAVFAVAAWYIAKNNGFNIQIEPEKKFKYEGSTVLGRRHK